MGHLLMRVRNEPKTVCSGSKPSTPPPFSSFNNQIEFQTLFLFWFNMAKAAKIERECVHHVLSQHPKAQHLNICSHFISLKHIITRVEDKTLSYI